MRNRSILIILLILAILTLLAIFFRGEENHFGWRESYKGDSKDPYGTYVINQLLRSYFPGQEFIELRDSMGGQLLAEARPASYIFIGEAMFLDSSDTRTLLDFVREGNQALISSRTIPFDIMFELYYDECNDFPWDDYRYITDTSATLNLAHPALSESKGFEYTYISRHKVNPYNWQYIDDVYFCEEPYSPEKLGYMKDSLVNFARIRYGSGTVFLHTTPIAFSNIQLLDEQGLSYAGNVFSHLHAGAIYWDEYNKVSEAIGRNRNRQYSRQDYRHLSSESPLQYILDQPSLAWAWYLLLAMGILYLIFRTRRRQRIIPVLEKNTNTSLEFTATIGRLYFLQNNHRQLALQKMKFLRAHIREHYHLHSREMDNEFIDTLTARSEISREKVGKILLMYRNIEQSNSITEKTLIDFHQLIDYFYKNAK